MSLKAMSKPPSTSASKIARIVTTVELPCEIVSQTARSQPRGGVGVVALSAVALSAVAPEGWGSGGWGSGGCGSGGTPLASSLTSPPLRPRGRRRARQDPG